MKNALILVDIQRDFCPGGALPAPGGNKIIPVVNSIIDKFDLVIASKDWHPARTIHFEKWPVHCVRATEGAAFHPQLDTLNIDEVVLKGTGNSDDGYSAFEATNMDLESLLRKNKITSVFVCGLTTEYCVNATALDALKAGFEVAVITDATAAVAANEGDEEAALEKMRTQGIKLLTSRAIEGKVAG